MNQTKLDFLNKLKTYFSSLPMNLEGKNLCVCLSGGADSVALLTGLLDIKQSFGFNIYACHFNHMIRGKEADNDERFCKDLCKSLSVEIFCGRDDVPAYAKLNNMSIEEAARECRYAFFSRLYSKSRFDYCATAHNMNDDAETLLFNIIRGSGANGASAIAPYKEYILRPMLKISRDEIEKFLGTKQQVFVVDSTNSNDEYTRNYIRHVVLPDIIKINPSAVEALSRYADSCRIDRDYFDNIVKQNINTDLRDLESSIRIRVIIKKYKDFSQKSLNSLLINEIDKSILSDSRKILPINNQHEAVIENGNVNFYLISENLINDFPPEELIDGNNLIFGNRVTVDISEDKFDSSKKINKISICNLLSFDNICGSVKARNRKIGDKIFMNGMNKSLKKLFIEKKIPKEYRDIIPIIFDDEGIIYVPFVGIADRALPKNKDNLKYISTTFNTIDHERWTSAYEE